MHVLKLLFHVPFLYSSGNWCTVWILNYVFINTIQCRIRDVPPGSVTIWKTFMWISGPVSVVFLGAYSVHGRGMCDMSWGSNTTSEKIVKIVVCLKKYHYVIYHWIHNFIAKYNEKAGVKYLHFIFFLKKVWPKNQWGKPMVHHHAHHLGSCLTYCVGVGSICTGFLHHVMHQVMQIPSDTTALSPAIVHGNI